MYSADPALPCCREGCKVRGLQGKCGSSFRVNVVDLPLVAPGQRPDHVQHPRCNSAKTPVVAHSQAHFSVQAEQFAANCPCSLLQPISDTRRKSIRLYVENARLEADLVTPRTVSAGVLDPAYARGHVVRIVVVQNRQGLADVDLFVSFSKADGRQELPKVRHGTFLVIWMHERASTTFCPFPCVNRVDVFRRPAGSTLRTLVCHSSILPEVVYLCAAFCVTIDILKGPGCMGAVHIEGCCLGHGLWRSEPSRVCQRPRRMSLESSLCQASWMTQCCRVL